MKVLLYMLICIISFLGSAQAKSEIGPPVTPILLSDALTLSAIDALVQAKPEDLKAFIASGNSTKNIQMMTTKPGTNQYKFTRQKCTYGGVAGVKCKDKASLSVTISKIQKGTKVEIISESSILLFDMQTMSYIIALRQNDNNECLNTLKAIFDEYGTGKLNYLDEINVVIADLSLDGINEAKALKCVEAVNENKQVKPAL